MPDPARQAGRLQPPDRPLEVVGPQPDVVEREGPGRPRPARQLLDHLQVGRTLAGVRGGDAHLPGLPVHDDVERYLQISPWTYAKQIETPLLILHSEQDLRCNIEQAEALFTVLRSHKAPVRLLRVPEETHELTRSGTPYRHIENLEIVRSWFGHFLVDGKRGLPPLPAIRAGR